MNEKGYFGIGAPVNYHPVIGQDRCIATRIRSAPWKLGHGTVVVKVDGVSGGVSFDALSFRFGGKE